LKETPSRYSKVRIPSLSSKSAIHRSFHGHAQIAWRAIHKTPQFCGSERLRHFADLVNQQLIHLF
jgi:hypothetical protein